MIARKKPKNRKRQSRRKRSQQPKSLLGTRLARFVEAKRLIRKVRPEAVEAGIRQELKEDLRFLGFVTLARRERRKS